MPRPKSTHETALIRFKNKIKIAPSGCHEWTGQIVDGYGRFRINTTIPWAAHRYAMFIKNNYQPLPKGMHVDHMCANRKCVNTDHLRLATPRENALAPWSESPSRYNMQKTHCQQGHEFNIENTYWRKDHPTHRMCKQCCRDRKKKA